MRPVPLEQPNYCPGSYSLHLYCKYGNTDHAWEEFPWQLDQFQTGGAARSYARRRGWILHRDGTATCPKCVKALSPSPKDNDDE